MVFSNPVIAVTLYSIVILILINVLYKFLINQNEAKNIKERQKQMRDEIKQAQKEGDKEKAKKLMGEMLAENSKMMRMTMKPMMVSLIIVIIVLPMIGNVYGDKEVVLENNEGTLSLDNEYKISVDENKIDITGPESVDCEMPCREKFHNTKWNIRSAEQKVIFGRVLVELPMSLPFIGDDLGWLGWYILISIPVMIISRRAMKIHI